MMTRAWMLLLFFATPARAASERSTADSLLWFAVVSALMLLVCVLWWLRARDCRMAGQLVAVHRELDRVMAEHARMEQDLQGRETMFRHLFDLAGVGIFRSTLAGDRFLVANRALARMYGHDSMERFMVEVRPQDVYDSLSQRGEMLRQLEQHGSIEKFELDYSRRDGSRGVVLMSVYLDTVEGCLEGSVLDITELRSAGRELERQHHFLQTLLNAIPNPVFYKDSEGRYRLLNDAFLRMMGKSAEDLLGRNVHEISPPELARTYAEMDAVLLHAAGQATQKYDSSVQAETGLRSVVFFKESVLDDQNRILGLVGTISDVTALREQERALRLATVRYRNILDNAVEGIVEMSAAGQLLDANAALVEMLGYSSLQDIFRKREQMGCIFTDPDRLEAVVHEVRQTGRVQRAVIPARRRDDSIAWLSLSLCGVFDDLGELERMHGLVLDVTVEKAEHDELARRARTDALTGLANRETLLGELERMMREAGGGGELVGVLFLDLDGFKDINDRWGHQTGDDVLVQVARRMRQRLRRHDVLARLGGDEFAILLWDIGNAENLRTVVGAILWDMRHPFECHGEQCMLGASVGGSLFPDHGHNSAELVSLADQAMYAVKRQGKNGLCVSGSEPVWFDVA